LSQSERAPPAAGDDPAARIAVSAFIITLNEEDRIEDAIRSVSWADEVIVVDSGSTDATVERAKALGAKIFFRAWTGYGEQKRFAEDQCRHDWLINLDADERVTPALRDEILALWRAGPSADIYKVRILDVFPHEREPAPWAFGQWQYRFYDRRKGRFSASTVHDTVRPLPEARLARLKGRMAHPSQRSIRWAVEKMNRYSDAQVADMVARGKRISPVRLLTEFPLSFLKSYLLRGNFRYGRWGVINSTNYAYSRFLRIAKLQELKLVERSRRNGKAP
jgi:glycosyltransferase involved in cell wall biosynthesis